VSPVEYELGVYIPEDCENLKPYFISCLNFNRVPYSILLYVMITYNFFAPLPNSMGTEGRQIYEHSDTNILQCVPKTVNFRHPIHVTDKHVIINVVNTAVAAI
jgi:hypothetical protein